MSNANLIPIRDPSVLRTVADTTSLTLPLGPLTYEDLIPFVVLSLRITTASVAIASGNEVIILWEQSWDDSASWQTVTGIVCKDSTGATIVGPTGTGTFIAYPTASSGQLSPIQRVTIAPPTGTSITMSGVYKRSVSTY